MSSKNASSKRQFSSCAVRAVVSAFFAGMLFGSSAYADEQKPAVAAPDVMHTLASRVERFQLENGLRVILFRRENAPVFAGQTWVKVGGVDEVPGKTGAAHLLEHMAFKGTDKIGTKDYAKEKPLLDELETLMHQKIKAGTPEAERAMAIYKELAGLWVDNDFSRIYQRRGGVGLNAGTAKDYTMYQIELPSVAFELWCWMESERVLHPVFRQFYKEREVVREERRMRTDDDPGGKLYEAMLATAYWNHPYRLPTIGWSSDIRSLTADDTMALQQRYYRPDNMVVVLVGDLDPQVVKPMIQKYFGRLPKADSILPVVTAEEEPQEAPREVAVPFDAEPSLIMAYHKPVYPDADDIYFSILHSLLSGGKSSVLHRELVVEKQLATGVGTSEAPGELFPSLFYVSATPRHGVTTRALMEEIQKTLDRIGRDGFSDEDFNAAKKRVKVGFLGGLDSNDELAETLGHAELLWNDWAAVLKMYEIVDGATKQNVQSLITKYLRPQNRTFAHLEKKEGGK
ncbi:MAG: pitrilysin family protein [Bdellovibrionota bacterium]